LGRIPEEVIQQLRDRVDIVDLVGRFVTLKRAGRNYTGLCPFHREKTPSFNVNPDRGAFYCFGCQEGGNAISFLMKVENLTFPEAARALAREHGIEIPESEGARSDSTEPLFAALELAQSAYRRALAEPGNPGAAYLEKRGIDAATIERFGIGFAPDRWDTLVGALRQRGIPAEVGERAGLLAARERGGHYDRLRGRVTFPIRDVRGRVIGFGGRAIAAGQDPKYLNTPETSVFRKREGFYGFPLALEPIRRRDRAVVVEGYFDLVALQRAGVDYVLATCGTALTPDHARNLRRRTREVVLLFDGDEAGQRAMQRALEALLPEGLRVRAAVLPGGLDPDDFSRERGAEALRALVEGAQPALDQVLRRAVARGVATPWAKADAVSAVAPLVALIPSAVERAEFVRQLALAVGSEVVHVEVAVRAAAGGASPSAAAEALPPAEARRSHATPLERNLRRMAQCLLDYPQLAAEVELDLVSALLPADHPLLDVVKLLLCEDLRAGDALERAAAGLRPEAAALLRGLAAEGSEIDLTGAERILVDTEVWLRRKAARQRQRELTQQLHDPGADVHRVLGEKKALIPRARGFSGPPGVPHP
jgi:DNA primase